MIPHLSALLLLATPTVAGEEGLLRLETAVAAHAAERLGLDALDVEVVHLGLAQAPLCAGSGLIEVQSRAGERFKGHADLAVRVYDDAGTCASLRLRPRLRVWTLAPVASRALAHGELVAWRLERVELDRLQGDAIGTEDLDSQRWLARASVTEGEPLTDLLLRPAPDALAGQQVQLLAGAGDLVVKAQGRLVADAFIGETVRTTNLATRIVLDTTLLSPGCVAAGSVTERLQEVCSHAH